MIPTRYKSKLSHKMTYPVSAGMLSTALADVPQYDRLLIGFHSFCHEPNKMKKPYSILRVEYSRSRANLNSSKAMIEMGLYEPRWMIYVDAVPKVIVRSVKHQLEIEGLEQVRQWLHLHQDATGKDGKCYLSLLYDVDADLLSDAETVELIDRN
jgi:hypothetical protein